MKSVWQISLAWALAVILTAAAPDLRAAPYAAMVMDARSGEVLHSRNADTRLHPASLTKMMTLYIAFEAVRRGEITMDTKVTVSRKAAAEEPSKLGLRAGQKIALRYLVRAAAVRSANDAATAIAEAISGSEAAFARRMNRTAKALGMTKTTFKNAHGLTEVGHMSTARDMTILGRRVLYDYPQYYNLFSRRSTDAGVKTVKNTNRRLLDAYPGADGIKTGYTRAAGSNLVASAERGSERIIATVFGGQSSSARNARIVELLDMGFQRAPTRVALRKPALPTYEGDGSAGRVVRTVTTIKRSQRPVMRPRGDPPAQLVAEADIMKALKAVQSAAAQTSLAPEPTIKVATAAPTPTPEVQKAPEPEIVTRISTSGGRLWGVNTGRFGSRFEAEQHLLKLALAEMNTLDGSLRKVAERSGGYDANFVGMTQEQADLACRRLAARRMNCFMIGPT